jgi:hypothetical protein
VDVICEQTLIFYNNISRNGKWNHHTGKRNTTEYITVKEKRTQTFKTRRDCIVRKCQELSNLCGSKYIIISPPKLAIFRFLHFGEGKMIEKWSKLKLEIFPTIFGK